MHDRKAIRLKGYDYSNEGFYFITICTKNRICYFGEYVGATHWVALNQFGRLVQKGWMNIPEIYNNVTLDEFVIMPNHIHGIIMFDKIQRASRCLAPTQTNKTLGYIIGQYKSSMTKILKRNGLNQDIWQRNYYERIIRNQEELNKIREYIQNNPLNWGNDRENGM